MRTITFFREKRNLWMSDDGDFVIRKKFNKDDNENIFELSKNGHVISENKNFLTLTMEVNK